MVGIKIISLGPVVNLDHTKNFHVAKNIPEKHSEHQNIINKIKVFQNITIIQHKQELLETLVDLRG